MDIDYLIDHFDDDAGNKEEVALIIYYLENREDNPIEAVQPADVREVIRNSRSAVTTSTVSSYFSRLNSDWISESNGDGYRLTHDGEDGVEALLPDGALDTPRDDGDRFIDSKVFEEYRYQQLVEDINESYRRHLYDATMVLTRKFFEDMVFQILKTHYAGRDNEMFYDQENNQHFSFDDLISNLREGVPTLRQYSRALDRPLVDNLRDLKEEGNSGAHKIRIDFDDDEVEGWSDDATRIAEVLYEVLQGAHIRDEQESS